MRAGCMLCLLAPSPPPSCFGIARPYICRLELSLRRGLARGSRAARGPRGLPADSCGPRAARRPRAPESGLYTSSPVLLEAVRNPFLVMPPLCVLDLGTPLPWRQLAAATEVYSRMAPDLPAAAMAAARATDAGRTGLAARMHRGVMTAAVAFFSVVAHAAWRHGPRHTGHNRCNVCSRPLSAVRLLSSGTCRTIARHASRGVGPDAPCEV